MALDGPPWDNPGIFSVIALFSGALGDRLRTRPSLANALRWLTGGVLVGPGLRLALPEHR